jgi:predicted MFS family arabinose efflux permease
VAVPLVLARMKESFGADTALDIRGLVLVTGGALGIVWGLVRGNSAGWGSAEVIASIAGGAVLGVGFVAWEQRTAAPMLPTSLFRSRAFSAGNAAIFCTFASLFAAVFFFAQFLQVGLGYGPFATGLRLLPWTATFITVAPVAGALADRTGERPLMTTGLVLQATGLAWLAAIATPGLAYSAMLGPLVVAGIGVSMAIPAAQNSVVGSVDADAIGKAAGANSLMRELGGVFGVAVAVAVFAGSGDYASPAAFTAGFRPAVAAAAVLALAGAVAAGFLPGRRRTAETAGFEPVTVLVSDGVGARQPQP